MSRRSFWGALAAVVVVLFAGYFTKQNWMPAARERLLAWLGAPVSAEKATDHPTEEDSHAGHDHAGHSNANSIEISKQAQENIGLKLGKVELSTYRRSVAIPGIIVERPGRSSQAITAPLTGIVTRIYHSQGEAVLAGQKLYDLQLTHEELVQGQGDFLRVAEELDVIENEIKRLQRIAVDGGIPGRQVLERQYERQNKQAVLRAQHQALLLHGLTEEQVKRILETRTLLRELTVSVPEDSGDGGEPKKQGGNKQSPDNVYEIQELRVTKGQSVAAGETLAILTDHESLLIEGNAFDKDIKSINKAVESNWPITAVLETDGAAPEKISDLKILFVAGTVDPEARTFRFYVDLSNKLIRDIVNADGKRYVSWRFKPGQRVQLSVPADEWTGRIVLPVDAVAQDGVETYVFSPNGDHFDRRSVHVEFRDRFSAVIANDGSIFPGDVVAVTGAQQMQLALKNKAGGGIDPHAGHNH
ncbi:MAG: efflux RND transporter periplasmic adaptor subunit [Planctomycetes bacterium]|nr:efflux RND transporter periplasmic adaptor subunit [Planctomycetota bacterium]